ncbi:hypothetical protein ACFPM0_37490, partial [Pseudonocardia sulfidoxydans]|uniref:hypothetical protein n=1 Tax=Pseudonocardia sulfidoxydans TaxID=54011 RepID=UPI003619C7A4
PRGGAGAANDLSGGGGQHVRVGVALRSPAALLALPELLRIADVVWLDHRALTARRTPLSRRADPRRGDPGHLPRRRACSTPIRGATCTKCFAGYWTRRARSRRMGPNSGVNLVGWQLEEPVVDFYRGLGLRRFAVDRDELLSARLLFGRTSEDDRGQAE